MKALNPKIKKTLKKIPQYTRLKRHILNLGYHSTPKKIINLIAVEFQRLLRLKKVIGYPYYIIIETGNICNLKCPLCPTGINLKGRKKQWTIMDDFKMIIDKLYPYAYTVSLHNWGEPFLNHDIFNMIAYCKEKNIGTNLSSNLSIDNFDAESVIKSGLEYLIVSLDGITQDVYSKYRVRGNYSLVIQNLVNLIQKKRELRSKTPMVEWQFIVMKHNSHQIDKAKQLAEQIGVNLIRFIPPGLPFGVNSKKDLAREWFPFISTDPEEGRFDDRFLQKPIKGGCFYLYRSVTINPGGAVAPCCVVWEEKDDFGNLKETNFSAIWNNRSYRSARGLFSKKHPCSPIKTPCNRCNLFAKAEIRLKKSPHV